MFALWTIVLFSSCVAETTECDIAILGCGIGGLYTADALIRANSSLNVCIVEHNAQCGGRVEDVIFPSAPHTVAGLGAWRLDESHTYMMSLIKRFSIATHPWKFVQPPLVSSRGHFVSNTSLLKARAFTTLLSGPFANMTDGEMWDYALAPERVARAAEFADLGAYLRSLMTPEGLAFMSAGQAFGVYSDMSVSGFVEFLAMEDADSGHQLRPKQGMSEIVRKLQASCMQKGVKIFTNMTVTSIVDSPVFGFRLSADTDSQLATFTAHRLVLAVPPAALARIGGDVPNSLVLSPEFFSLKAQFAFKGAAAYHTPWWQTASFPAKTMQRYMSREQCLGYTVSYNPGESGDKPVLDSIYAVGECAREWDNLRRRGQAAMDAAITDQLSYLFPGATVPLPDYSAYKFWEDGGWHFQKSGTNFTLPEIQDWATQPLLELRGRLVLVGEAYSIRRTWCEGALISAANAVKALLS